VMGPTGTGKSSLISRIIGKSTGVGHGLESETENIWSHRFKTTNPAWSGDLVLIDTPGFNDTRRTATEVLKQVSTFLEQLEKNDFKLAGVLYLHRITDNRVATTVEQNLRLFKRMCGERAMPQVVVATTMWDLLPDRAMGKPREEELIKYYWKDVPKPRTARVEPTPESSWQLLTDVVLAGELKRSWLIQDEMVGEGKILPETSVGRELHVQLKELLRKQNDRLLQLQDLPPDDPERQSAIEEYKSLRAEIKAIIADMEDLRIPLKRKLLRLVRLFAKSVSPISAYVANSSFDFFTNKCPCTTLRTMLSPLCLNTNPVYRLIGRAYVLLKGAVYNGFRLFHYTRNKV
ncbi:hypothetical protein M422DRAFT_188824, partial [Sphaerobolus stellatus SS14]